MARECSSVGVRGSGGKTPKVDRETVGLQGLKQSSEPGGSGAFVLTEAYSARGALGGVPRAFPIAILHLFRPGPRGTDTTRGSCRASQGQGLGS